MQSQQDEAASILSVVAITTPFAYASNGDSSETETEQELKQKNVGSGESVNHNCGQNLIDSDSLPTWQKLQWPHSELTDTLQK